MPHDYFRSVCTIFIVISMLASAIVVSANEPPALTSMSDKSMQYAAVDKPYVVLSSGDVSAVVVDNSEVDDDILPGHRGGYNGIGSLKVKDHGENLFVPAVAGLNFEHVHDGSPQDRAILFGPRNAPMELRVIDERTAELYQKASLHYGLESCTRYHLLEDGTIEMTFECIPRVDIFQGNYIGLFWASYIHQPESLDILFKGHKTEGPIESRWIQGITPAHGTLSTHLASKDERVFSHDDEFPLTLVFNRSDYRYSEPWYYGLSHGLAFVPMFRPQDQVRITQSPSGGGKGNPAWDFQFFISDYEIGKRYQFILRAMVVPFESNEQLERVSAPHRAALGQ